MKSSSNSVRENSFSAKQGFLLADALVTIVIIAMLALMTDCALRMHASMLMQAEKAVSTIEEEASWHLKECQDCSAAPEEDSSSEEP